MSIGLQTLEIERRGSAVWIWMNKPEVHNAFDETLIAELTSTVRGLDADDAIRAIVLAGRGKSFSAGADLNWMKRQGAAGPEQNLADARKLAALFRAIAECATPTLARVHGAALGGGMGLAAACDICIAADRASFATSEVRFGLIPSAMASKPSTSRWAITSTASASMSAGSTWSRPRNRASARAEAISPSVARGLAPASMIGSRSGRPYSPGCRVAITSRTT